jgi:hypothetical protein
MTGCKSLFAINITHMVIAHMVSGLFSGHSSRMPCLSADACKSGIRFSSECFAYLRSSIRGTGRGFGTTLMRQPNLLPIWLQAQT